jgi:hypothetical protein
MKFVLKSGLWSDRVKAEDLEEAMGIADEAISYNQESMTVCDEDGNILAQRHWWGSLDGVEECDSPITIGEGFYDDWEEVE